MKKLIIICVFITLTTSCAGLENEEAWFTNQQKAWISLGAGYMGGIICGVLSKYYSNKANALKNVTDPELVAKRKNYKLAAKLCLLVAFSSFIGGTAYWYMKKGGDKTFIETIEQEVEAGVKQTKHFVNKEIEGAKQIFKKYNLKEKLRLVKEKTKNAAKFIGDTVSDSLSSDKNPTHARQSRHLSQEELEKFTEQNNFED